MFFVRPDTKIFEALFTQSADPIAILGRQGGVVQLNPAWHDVLGWTLEELSGESLLHFVHFNDIPTMLNTRTHLDLPGTHSVHGELRFLHKDGTWRTLEFNATSFDGYHFAIYRDISERIQSELNALNTLDQTNAVLDAALDPIVVIDRESMVLQANFAFKRLFEINESERIDRDTIPFVTEEDRQNVLTAIRKTFDQGECESVTSRVRRADGEILTIEARGHAIPTSEGLRTRCVFILRDVSASSATHDALEASRKAIEEVSFAKSDYIAGLSHELRTPLNAVLGFAQILQLESDSPSDVVLANHICESSQHLLALTDEAMDFSRSSAGVVKASRTKMNLKTVLRESVESLMPLAKARKIDLLLRQVPEAEVWSDPRRVKQIILNLVSNAIKYNRRNGLVIIACAASDEWLRVSVSDTGAGIDPELSSRLFTRFDRLDREDAFVEGTGLGLALSKQLTEELSGQIGFESHLGEGSTFWVEFERVLEESHQSV